MSAVGHQTSGAVLSEHPGPGSEKVAEIKVGPAAQWREGSMIDPPAPPLRTNLKGTLMAGERELRRCCSLRTLISA